MDIDDIKRLIADSPLKRDVAVIRAAWIAYGGLLAQCPHKQGAKIGQWVREQGLDFVEDTDERSASRRLYILTSGNSPKLDACPYSRPTDVLKWLRAQEADDTDSGAEADEPAQAGSSQPTGNSPEARFSAAMTELRNAFRALPGSYIKQHFSTPMEGTHDHKISKPLDDASVTWADGVSLPAIVDGAVLDVRIYIAKFDVDAPAHVSGLLVKERP